MPLSVAKEEEASVNDSWDPGAVKFGNFINYYSFHPPDKRLRSFAQQVWRFQTDKNDLVCLDVGCNTGDLTVGLHDVLTTRLGIKSGSCHVLAVDIDPVLIERAQEKNSVETIQYKCTDVLDVQSNDVIRDYLNAHSATEFNVTFLFSVTMWIHLNGGDEGLRSFLVSCATSSRAIVIEAQPWKCYKAAVRRLKRAKKPLFPAWGNLKYKETILQDINDILQQSGFSKVFESDTSSWGRTTTIFIKNSS